MLTDAFLFDAKHRFVFKPNRFEFRTRPLTLAQLLALRTGLESPHIVRDAIARRTLLQQFFRDRAFDRWRLSYRWRGNPTEIFLSLSRADQDRVLSEFFSPLTPEIAAAINSNPTFAALRQRIFNNG